MKVTHGSERETRSIMQFVDDVNKRRRSYSIVGASDAVAEKTLLSKRFIRQAIFSESCDVVLFREDGGSQVEGMAIFANETISVSDSKLLILLVQEKDAEPLLNSLSASDGITRVRCVLTKASIFLEEQCAMALDVEYAMPDTNCFIYAWSLKGGKE